MPSCLRCQAENPARARFCGACGAGLREACPACGEVVQAGQRFCHACGGALVPPGPGAAPGEPPEPLRTAAASDGERRQATVVFADLVGYTALTERSDAEDVEALLTRIKAEAARVVERHGGTVNQFVGDEVMALFGVPLARRDDPHRAVDAALDLHAAVGALVAGARPATGPLELHTGIATGVVVVRRSDARAGDYTVTGDAVNSAARLRSAAPAGVIAVGAETWSQVAEAFEGEALTPVEAKGKRRPLVPWRILRRRPPTAPATGTMVGRTDERREFAGLLEACVERRRGRVVVVRGDPGVGKTRLVAELTGQAGRAGVAVHAAAVLDFGAETGRDAVRTLARSLLGLAVDADAKARLDAIGALAAAESLSDDRRLFLHDVADVPPTPALRPLVDAMSAAARERGALQAFVDLVRLRAGSPVALVVEDIHWADAWTLERLAAVAALSARHPLLVVMTTRFAGDPSIGAWRTALHGAPLLAIDLAPLGASEAKALAASASGALPASQIDSCVARAEGNPLFLLQLLLNAGEAATSALPGSIQAIVHARMDHLVAADKAALQAAAVLGQRFSIDAVRHLAGDAAYDCRALVEHYLVRPEPPEHLFCHALIRDGAYASLLGPRRRALHARAAEWFESAEPALAAEHYERAQHPKAARAYFDAATASSAQRRDAAALSLVERGLALAEASDDRFRGLLQRASLLVELVRPQDAEEAARLAIGAAPGDRERAQSLIVLAAALRLADRSRDGLVALDEAEPLAKASGLGIELSRLHLLRGNLLFPLGRVDECAAAHQRALDVARAVGSREAEAAALGGLGDAAYLQCRMASAWRQFSECVELSRQHGFGRLEVANLPMTGWAGYWLLRIRESADAGREAIELAVRAAQPRAELLARVFVIWLDGPVRRRLDDAAEECEAALQLAIRLRSHRFEAQTRAIVAMLAWQRGDAARAVAEAAAALAICRQHAMSFFGPWALGTCALVDPDPATRRRFLAEGEAELAHGAVSFNHLVLREIEVEVGLELGDWDEVDRACERLIAFTRREPLPYTTLLAARGRALAQVGRGDRNDALRRSLLGLRDEAASAGLDSALAGIDRGLAAFAGGR